MENEQCITIVDGVVLESCDIPETTVEVGEPPVLDSNLPPTGLPATSVEILILGLLCVIVGAVVLNVSKTVKRVPNVTMSKKLLFLFLQVYFWVGVIVGLCL